MPVFSVLLEHMNCRTMSCMLGGHMIGATRQPRTGRYHASVLCVASTHEWQDDVLHASGAHDWGDSSAKDGKISCQCFVCCLNT